MQIDAQLLHRWLQAGTSPRRRKPGADAPNQHTLVRMSASRCGRYWAHARLARPSTSRANSNCLAMVTRADCGLFGSLGFANGTC